MRVEVWNSEQRGKKGQGIRKWKRFIVKSIFRGWSKYVYCGFLSSEADGLEINMRILIMVSTTTAKDYLMLKTEETETFDT